MTIDFHSVGRPFRAVLDTKTKPLLTPWKGRPTNQHLPSPSKENLDV